MSRLIYTAIMGKPDVLRAPVVASDDHWICFTDLNPPRDLPEPWGVAPMRGSEKHPRWSQRHIKITWFPIVDNYDSSIYIDANCRLLVAPDKLFDVLGDADVALIRHHHHSTPESFLGVWPKPLPRMTRQLDEYRASGLPESVGFWLGGLVVRRHTPACAAFSQLWWEEVRRWQTYDQFSLPWAIWKSGVSVATLDPSDGWIARGRHAPRAGAPWTDPPDMETIA